MERVVRISMEASAEDDSEATRVLRDLLEHLRSRLEFWGYELGAQAPPVSLVGEIL